jgi:hypothetical protein
MSAMTELLTRTPRSRSDQGPSVAPGSTTTVAALGAGVIAAGASLLVIAVIVITTWAASLRSGAGAADALRAVAYVWLVAHRVSVDVAGGHIALLPIGLLVVPAYVLIRAGKWFAHATDVADVRGAVTGGLTIAVAYGFVAAVVASGSASHTVHPAAGEALIAGFCVGMAFSTTGIALGAGLVQPLWSSVPVRARAMATAGGAGIAVLLATGAVLAVGGVLLHMGRVVSLGGSLGPGAVGASTLALACVAYLPTAAVWGASYAVGPGFSVGAHTSVSPLGVHLGAVPSFPLLGGLPGSGPAPALSFPFVVMPLVAGAVIGVLLIRRYPAHRIEGAALGGLATGALAGGVVGLIAALAGGPVGPGRMATVGPSAWQVGLAAAVELGIAAAAAAAETQRRLLRD